MSDIVTELRMLDEQNAWIPEAYGEAADEIERLRAEVATLREALKNHGEEAAKMVSAEPVVWMYEKGGYFHFQRARSIAPGYTETPLFLAAPEISGANLPEGWPTQEMIEAGAKMFEATLHSAADFKHHAVHVFNAMLAAFPQPTKEK